MAVKISKTGKLDGIRSWSLQAIETCPSAHAGDGNLVEVCQGCYATEGHYRMRNVKDVRSHNKEDWKRDGWVGGMIDALDTDRYFRWFDSGDIYHPRLAIKILEVVQRTPWCKHWIPTRSHKIDRIRPILEAIHAEPNAVVRYSSDSINEYTPGVHGSVVVTADAVPDGVTICRAYDTKPARCNGCRACWDKSVGTIGYIAHGHSMARTLKRKDGYFDIAA